MEHVTDDCTCEGKRCTKCQELQCVRNYTKDKRLRSGLKSRCCICSHEDNKQWRQNNREYDQERHKIWNEANHEHAKDMRKQHRLKNAEREEQYRKEYREKNAGQIRARALQRYYRDHEKITGLRREQYRRNREHLQAKWRRYYAQNRDYHNQRVMKYFDEHPGYRASVEAKRRTRKRQAGGSYTYGEWEALKAKYNYTCLCCGKQEPEIKLHADHVIPVFRNGSSLIENIQPLCKSCNSSKGRQILDFRPQNT